MADHDSPLPVTILLANYVIVIDAVDPTTGATVSGVVISDVSISGINVAKIVGVSQDLTPILIPAGA